MAAGATPVSLSGNIHIDALLAGMRASTSTLTYGFPTADSNWTGYAPGSEPYNQFTPLTATQQMAVSAALASWASVANLTFTQVSEPGQVADIRYSGTAATNTAQTYYPNASPLGSDAWFGPRMTNTRTWQLGRYPFETVVHETGHALGLKHPHDSSIGSAVGDNAESIEMSVMSYQSYAGAPLTNAYTVAADSYPSGPMLDDIAAVQYLYGANYTNNADNTVYRFTPDGDVIFRTIWDGGGIDTYDLSAYTEDQVISLEPGQWSSFSHDQLAHLNVNDPSVLARGNIANAYLNNDDPRALIENVIAGTGNDAIWGNRADNTLFGNLGNDTLLGGAGNDILFAGPGNDQLWGDSGNDVLFGDGGADALIGGAGGDLFYEVAGPGADIAYDFNYNEGDRIQIDGTDYTVGSGPTGAVISFAGGSLSLYGIAPNAVAPNWFVKPAV